MTSVSTRRIEKHVDELGKIRVPSLENEFTKSDLGSAVRQLNIEEGFGLLSNIEDCYERIGPKDEYVNLFRKNLFDHGVLGAISLEDFPLEACQAIALHNSPQVEINFLENPIAFFLVLCDEAQEWGRWLVSDTTEKFFVPVETIEWKLTDKVFKVKVDFGKNPEQIKNNKPNFDVKKLVCDKFFNLSRLKVPAELNLTIEFSVIDLKEEEWKISLSDPSDGWKLTRQGVNMTDICDGL